MKFIDVTFCPTIQSQIESEWSKVWKVFQMWLQKEENAPETELRLQSKSIESFLQLYTTQKLLQFIPFKNPMQLYTFAIIYHLTFFLILYIRLQKNYIFFETFSHYLQYMIYWYMYMLCMWGLPIKAGLARALKSSIFLRGSVIVSHLRRKITSKQFCRQRDRKWSCQRWWSGKCDWHICQLYQVLQLLMPRDQTAQRADLNLHSEKVKIFWRQDTLPKFCWDPGGSNLIVLT